MGLMGQALFFFFFTYTYKGISMGLAGIMGCVGMTAEPNNLMDSPFMFLIF
jgi:hypothetical protein